MKASVEEINKVQRRIKIELGSDVVNSAFDTVYKKVQKKANIKGFRPGKAPLTMIRKFYGQAVAADVADQLVRNHLFTAIQDKSLRPIATPVLETVDLPEENKDYNFSALVDIMPEIKINGHKGLKLSFKPVKSDASALERELDLLRRRQAKTRDLGADIAAKAGHLAYISHKGFDDKGQPIHGADATSLPVEIGRKELYPEMEDALVGMKPGDKKTINFTLPQDYQDKDLAGKKVKMDLHLEKVEELVLPELDDEFAKDLGSDSMNALKERIEKSLKDQAEQQKRSQLEFDILRQLAEKNPIDVPPSLVDQVIDSMIDNMQWPSDKERNNAKRNTDIRQRFMDGAKERTRNTLILHEIIQEEKLEVQDDEIDQHILEMMGGAGMKKPDEKIMANLKKSFGPQARENLLINKAIDFVIGHATVSEQKA